MISPVWFPVPPTGYGGIEWVVWLLADGLVDAGHEVTLFASGDSHTKAQLSSVFPVAPSARIGQTLPELQHCLAAYARADEFDVINDHSGLPAAAIGGLIDKPVLHTIHGPLDGEGGAIYEQIAEVAPRIGFISISMNQRKPKPDFPWVANCPNALDFSLYPVVPHRGDYLLLPRADEPGQGLPPRDRRRGHRRAAAEDRRQEPRAARAAVLRRSSSRRISPTRSSTSARSRTARRSSCSRTREPPSSRSSGRSRSAW